MENDKKMSNSIVMPTPPPAWMTPAPRPRKIFSFVSPIQDSPSPVTFVQESPEMLDQSKDMFESSILVQETPIPPPIPPPMPKLRAHNFIESVPITPVRLQGQRWKNWALTRLSHLP